MKKVRIDLPTGGWLQGDVAIPAGARSAVLFIHGFGSVRRGEKAAALRLAAGRRGWAFAAFDFRGHGESSGTMLDLGAAALLDDLAAIRTWLAGRGIEQLCPVGSSMGGWAAAWFTMQHPQVVPACVLLAPAFFWLTSRWSKLTEGERGAWQETGKLRVANDWIDTEISYRLVEESSQFPIKQLMDSVARPLLIFHGMADDVVPYSHSVYFVEQSAAASIELRLFKDGDHRLTAYRNVIAESACAFFARFTSSPSTDGTPS